MPSTEEEEKEEEEKEAEEKEAERGGKSIEKETGQAQLLCVCVLDGYRILTLN